MTWKAEFDQYTGRASKFQDANEIQFDEEKFIKVFDSDIGRNVGFKRVAVHHLILPPGYRTSIPHAESLEEEFVYVLKGSPHLWLNGYIYDLAPGFAVGFPAGTGVAHNLINNSDSDVHLLVAGDQTKKDNLCSFPINPELKKDIKIWWENPPEQKIGPHSGLPGIVLNSDMSKAPSPYVLNCNSEAIRRTFHYPGDNETFGEGLRISNKIGLYSLGIWHERLPSGRRAAFPHAHSHEEEFVYILSGNPTLWLDGFLKQLSPGDFAAFPPNTGIAHTLINDTDENVEYICIGESQEFSDEKLSYPHQQLRQLECERLNCLWRELPEKEMGPHDGKPKLPFEGHLNFVPATVDNLHDVFEIFQKSKQYFLNVDGCEPNLKIAKSAITDIPSSKSERYIKECLIVKSEGQNIGVLELHINHPGVGICYIGLLLITNDSSGRGLGTRVYGLAEDYLWRSHKCNQIRLGVAQDNDVSGFWLKMGFQQNGNIYTWKGEHKTSIVREFEKNAFT
jgi:uncharacterized cupin superfamily protein/RimJ/RimL family protein N-acetyltransferase